MGALQWMGAVKMRVKTADKNITIIHTTPVHLLTSYKVHCCFWQSIITLPPVKNPVVLLNPLPYLFRTVYTCHWCLICAYFSPDSDKTNVSLEYTALRIEDSYFSGKLFELKNILTGLFTKIMWTTCGKLWCFHQALDQVNCSFNTDL